MQFFALDSVDSTNDVAKRLLREGAIRDVAYVVAAEQTGGRGTRGRSWTSPRGAGIYLSLVHVADGRAWPVTTAFTQSAAVACVEALRDRTGVAVDIKPVNDLFVAGRKLGGILTETVVTGQHVEAIITGIGINVREAVRQLDGREVVATSLQAETTREAFDRLDVDGLIRAIVERVCARHKMVFENRLDDLAPLYQARLAAGVPTGPPAPRDTLGRSHGEL
ncbi:MAG: biotin--[acetyl-CoA-carboxylase] ligase [Phycisphaerales bacterium]|nr:biotin--[acetyl-CoA-carboxylase] ligase [Phycisphaerales bacterium]